MTEEIRISGHRGNMLVGTLRLPKGKGPFKVALLLHGWNSNRQGARNAMVAERLEQDGIASLAIDFRGHGDSTGDIRDADIMTEVDDVLDAYKWLGDDLRFNMKKGIGISGASIGGSVALIAAATKPEAFRCVSLVSARLDFVGVAEDEYCFDGPNGRVENRAMLPMGKTIDFYAAAERIQCPVQIIHGTEDECIPIEQPIKLVGMYPKMELIRIRGGNHRLDRWIPQISRDIADFLADHLGS